MRFNLILLSSLSASALVSASITPSSSTDPSLLQERDIIPDSNQSIPDQVEGWEMALGERSHEKKTSYKKKHSKSHNHKADIKEVVDPKGKGKSGVRVTYYAGNQLNNPACGGPTPNDNDMVAAVVKDGGYGSCGDKMTLTSGGKSVTVTIVDYCEGCPSPGGFDLTKGAFKKLAPLSQGVIDDFKYWKD